MTRLLGLLFVRGLRMLPEKLQTQRVGLKLDLYGRKYIAQEEIRG